MEPSPQGCFPDLVFTDADPLADIKNARRILSVVVGGHVVDRSALDRMLGGVEEMARDPAHAFIHRPTPKKGHL